MLLACCPAQEHELPKPAIAAYARMEPLLAEVSGLEQADSGTFWAIRDSGSPSVLYRITTGGALLDSVHFPLPNQDWEDLARDAQGNIYIGDFGNNANRRKDLRIYKFSKQSGSIDTIAFQWEDQHRFPPPKEALNFDCEAFLWYQDQLHLFTKSRGDKKTRHYVVPDQAGAFKAKLQETVYINDLVTAADISPNGNTLALLTYGKVYLFTVTDAKAMFQAPARCIRIPWAGQSEAILFINNNSLVLSNETRKLFYVQVLP